MRQFFNSLFFKFNKLNNWIIFGIAFSVPFIWMAILRISTFNVGENSLDGLYHAGIAELGPSVYLSKHFTWTQMSLWFQHFADKELLYHASLDGIFRLERLFGFTVQPPFHFAALCFIAFSIAGFLFAAHSLRIRKELLLAGALFFPLLIPTFTFRLSVLRPHVLSIACMMFIIGIMVRGSFKFRLIAISVISFFFAWSYSNPHFIVIVPLFFSIFHAIKGGSKKELLIPLASFFAVMLGLLIHPQFPNSFLIWKTQSWDALVTPMKSNAALTKPMEMLPPSFGFHRTSFAFYLVFLSGIILMCRLTEHHGLSKINWHLFPLCVLSCGFTIALFIAARAVEYSTPFTILFFLLLLEELLKADITIFHRHPHFLASFIFLFSIATATYSTLRFRHDCPHVISTPIPQIAAYLQEHVPANSPVINLDWSDFPPLFYYDRNHYWQWGMDPMFSYVQDPQRTMMLTRTRPGHGGETYPQDLYKAFGCKYAVILWPRVPHASALYESGWKLVKAFTEKGHEEGWIFALDERSLHPTSSLYQKNKDAETKQSEEKQNVMRDNPT